jgi:hypothetical protein
MRIFLLLLALLALPLAVTAQESDPNISLELAAELDGLEAWVIDTRGLQPTEPVIRVFPTRQQASDFIIGSLDEQLTPEIVAEVEAFYTAFDFTEPGTDIVAVYLNLLQDQVGGYYNPEDKTMNTILLSGAELGDALPSLEKIIYVHEYVHALQDQVFGLQEIGMAPEAAEEMSGDAVLAMQSLVEGDATLVMNAYTEYLIEQNPMAALGLLTGSFASGSTTMPAGTPPILVRELTFPYLTGAEFVAAIYREGGWEAVNAAFSNLPVSTEQVIHPEAYLNGDLPITVELASTEGIFSADWTAFEPSVLGEFYLRAYLDTQLAPTEHSPAAAGWGGDSYQVWQNTEGETAMLLRNAWDTPADAEEFVAIVETFAAARSGAALDGTCWTGPADTMCLAELATGETVLTVAPDAETAEALLLSQS